MSGNNVPIVQGMAISNEQSKLGGASWFNPGGSQAMQQPQVTVNSSYVATNEMPSGGRPASQKKFQDVFWAILFYAHLAVIIVLIVYGIGGQNGGGGGMEGFSSDILFMVCVTGLAAIGLSSFCLSFMMNNSESLVQTALVFSVLCSLAVAILGFMTGSILMGIIGIISFAIGICYARLVWHRIPFAAANLSTALSAVRANLGLSVVAYGFTGLAILWSLFWFWGLGGALQGGTQAAWVAFLLFVSYYWVHQVLQNTVHVTTAGVIGTWWFVPDEASSFCGPAIFDSFFRATTYSFGSICFGSLLVALVQALRALEHYTRNNDDAQIVSCLIQCILACLESILEYLNKWAYIYVGLYGFSYLDASRNVIQLFEQKGWTVIITDDLADNVLFMMSIAIGLAVGLFGVILGFLDKSLFQSLGFENSGGPAFLMGFLTGFLIASILMSVVGSAVNTVIVCFAEAPREFEQNHPALSARMRGAWTQAWPELRI